MKGRVLLSAGSRPYISVKIPSALEPLAVLEETLKLMQEPAEAPSKPQGGKQ